MRYLRKHIVFALLLAIVATAAYIACTRPHTLAPEECSGLYRRYTDCPGVHAAYIKDYRVNDTLTLSATVLEATGDSAWGELRARFNSVALPSDSAALAKGLDILELVLGENCKSGIIVANEFAVLSLRDRYACVFQNIDEKQREPFVSAILDKIFNTINNKQKLTNNEKSI